MDRNNKRVLFGWYILLGFLVASFVYTASATTYSIVTPNTFTAPVGQYPSSLDSNGSWGFSNLPIGNGTSNPYVISNSTFTDINSKIITIGNNSTQHKVSGGTLLDSNKDGRLTLNATHIKAEGEILLKRGYEPSNPDSSHTAIYAEDATGNILSIHSDGTANNLENGYVMEENIYNSTQNGVGYNPPVITLTNGAGYVTTNEGNVRQPIPVAGHIKQFNCNIKDNTRTSSTKISLSVNGGVITDGMTGKPMTMNIGAGVWGINLWNGTSANWVSGNQPTFKNDYGSGTGKISFDCTVIIG